MRAQGVGDGGLDGVGVGEAHHDAPGVGCAESLEGSDDPGLHLREALTAREAEGRRAVLYGLPLRQGRQFGDRGAGPLAEVAFEQAGVVVHFEPRAGCCGLRCLARALQRRGIDAVDGQALEPIRDPFSLGPAPVGKMQSRDPPRQHSARGRRLPVAHQKEERAVLPRWNAR